LTNEDTTSTQLQIPPPENEQNHAQNTESGDSGDSGGTLPTLEGRCTAMMAIPLFFHYNLVYQIQNVTS